jgi:hypothetical protein
MLSLANSPDQRVSVRPDFRPLKDVRILQALENAALRNYLRQIDHIVELRPVVVIEAHEQPRIAASKKLYFLIVCRFDCRLRISLSAAAMCSGCSEACSISQSQGSPSPR